MVGDMFSGLQAIVTTLFFICLISVPLGLWKLVEIFAWLFKHISFSWN